MVAEELNRDALDALKSRNWERAQELFFKNAKENPSYQTYNNLGFFLITEGFTYRSGEMRSAHKLGMKYLLKSSEIKETSVNFSAIAEACIYELRVAKDDEKESLYNNLYENLASALKLGYSNENFYNILKLSFIRGRVDSEILENAKRLFADFKNEDSASLLLSAFASHSLYDEGEAFIRNYGDLLSEIARLVFYAKLAHYEKGYPLCEAVIKKFSIGALEASAIIECCLNSGNSDKAIIYSDYIKENSYTSRSEKAELSPILNNIEDSSSYRKEIIQTKYSIPTFMHNCCYFGCDMHKTPYDVV